MILWPVFLKYGGLSRCLLRSTATRWAGVPTSRDILWPNKLGQHGERLIIETNGRKVIVTHGVMRREPYSKVRSPKARVRIKSTYAHSYRSLLSSRTGITATFVTAPAWTRDKCNIAGSYHLFGSTSHFPGRKLQYILMARSPQAPQFQTGIVEFQYKDFMFHPIV